MKLNSIHSITSSELNAFFEENRQRTLCYLESRFPVLQEDDIEDIFQDSSIALFLKIQNNELLDLTSSLYTFFLSICINQARNKVNRTHPTYLLSDNITDSDFEPIRNDKLEELETDQEYLNWIEQQVREGVRQMKPPCNQILWSFYWDGLTHRTIADMFGMKSEDVSKTQANRCKHKFSDFIKKVMASYER